MSALKDRAWVLIVLVAVAARVPALGWDWFCDDHGWMLALENPSAPGALRWWSLFDFGTRESLGAARESIGDLPWWTSPDWKVRFFRPLASATHALDEMLFGRSVALHRATTLLWFALLLALTHRLYRALGASPLVSALALAIFAFEDGSLLPVSWLSNRNTVVETAFTVSAALAALRARSSDSWLPLSAALFFALCAALAKESGVAAFVVVALLLRSGGDARRQRRLSAGAALSIVIACGYVAALLGCGFGTRSEFYLTPWGSPLDFAARASTLLAFGSFSAFGPFPVDVPVMFPALFWPWLATAVLAVAFFGAACERASRGLGARAILCAWALVTLLPQAGATPSDRLLFGPMVALAPLIACCVAVAFEPQPRRKRVVAFTLAALTVPVSGLALVARELEFERIIRIVNEAATSFDVPRDGSACDAFVLQAPSQLTMLSPNPVWRQRTGLHAINLHPLQCGRRALRIERLDARTLAIESLDEPFAALPVEGVFRASASPPDRGARLGGPAFSVVAEHVDARGLWRVRLEFSSAFEDSRWRFLTWREGRFARVELPTVGAVLELPRAEALDPSLP